MYVVALSFLHNIYSSGSGLSHDQPLPIPEMCACPVINLPADPLLMQSTFAMLALRSVGVALAPRTTSEAPAFGLGLSGYLTSLH